MGLTVIDAGVLIGFVDSSDAHHQSSVREMRAALDRGDDLSIPASALAEALVGPSRKGEAAVRRLRDVVARLPLAVAAVDEELAVATALLRARHAKKLRLPDALVVATAMQLGADNLVTTDHRWPTARALGWPGRLVAI